MISENKTFNIKKWVIWALVIVLVLWSLNWLAIFLDANPRGTLGDMFGAVNALFSGLAFAGIIITIYMQKHELELQREELSETRTVFKGQNELMTAQQNDNTFFNLLENHRQLIESFKTGNFKSYGGKGLEGLRGHTEAISGYEVLKGIVTHWEERFSEYERSLNTKLIVKPQLSEGNSKRDYVVNPYVLVNDYPGMFNLFKDIRHLLIYINTKFKEDKQSFYKTILWNNLSDDEKYIFEFIYINYDNLREGLAHEPEVYGSCNYSDINKPRVPELSFDFYWYDDINRWVFSKKSRFESVKLVIYDKPYRGNLEFGTVRDVNFDKYSDEFRFYLEEILDPNYNEFDQSLKGEFRNSKFALVFEYLEKKELFRIVIGLNTELFDLESNLCTFQLKGISYLDRSEAEEICEEIDLGLKYE